MYLFLLLLNILFSSYLSSNPSEGLISEVLDNYFTDIPRNEISITPLTGGHSNISLKIETPSGTYVLRITEKESSQASLNREIYAMKEAMKLGIGPRIHYITTNLAAVLMDYVKDNTLTFGEAKDPKICAAIASTFRKFHNTAKNPYIDETFNDSALKMYEAIANNVLIQDDLKEAVALIETYTQKLDKLGVINVNTHGELNSRNIFITEQGPIFIDWEYTGWEERFFDLSYFALRLDYNEAEERFLLESYLERIPTFEELEKFALTKKIHFAQLCIYFHSFSLNHNPEQAGLDKTFPSLTWSDYMKAFADREDKEENLGQLYYDLARVCLKHAKE